MLLIRARDRGRLGFANLNQLVVEVDPDEVFRLENDPAHRRRVDRDEGDRQDEGEYEDPRASAPPPPFRHASMISSAAATRR